MVREMSDVAAKRFHFKKVNLRAAACLLLLPFLLLLLLLLLCSVSMILTPLHFVTFKFQTMILFYFEL